MGTSTSGKGPSGGVPFDPPWLDDILPSDDGAGPAADETDTAPGPPVDGEEHIDGGNENDQRDTEAGSPGIAPAGRFGAARTSLGNYARSGDRSYLRQSLGHYTRRGLGGASRAASRLRVSSNVAGLLAGTLRSMRDGTDAAINAWMVSANLAGASAEAVIAAVIERVGPLAGILDSEACKDAAQYAFIDLMELKEDVDPMSMSDDDIWTLTDRFIGNSIFMQVMHDMGERFDGDDLDPTTAVARVDDMREYIITVVSSRLGDARKQATPITNVSVQRLARQVTREAFEVFSEAEE
jgi:hypothetical protein